MRDRVDRWASTTAASYRPFPLGEASVPLGEASVAWVNRVVKVDAGEDGKHVSPEECHQKLEGSQQHDHDQ